LLICFRGCIPSIVQQPKLDLRNAIALIGEFAIDALGATDVTSVISAFGIFKRAGHGNFGGHQYQDC
jgi:hypothetical protein